MAAYQIAAALTNLQDQDIVEFFNDTISFLKGERVPFLSKYGENAGCTNVVPMRDFMIDLIQAGLRRSSPSTTLDVVKEAVLNYINQQGLQVESKFVEIIVVCIFARREEMRRVFTELVLQRQTDSHLVDYNYNIELTIASESSMKINEPLLVLELFLKLQDGKQEQRVVLEMNQNEAKTFVGKLREIEKELISSAQ